MKTSNLQQLAQHIEDIVENDGGELLHVEMSEMGDGSRRDYAIITTYSCGLEQRYRISSPAPSGGPSWTWSFDRWLLEVSDGDGWVVLSTSDVEV